MTTREFIELVEKLRAAQKRYFKTRQLTDLTGARKFETEVDLFLRKWRDQQNQKPLFDYPEQYPG